MIEMNEVLFKDVKTGDIIKIIQDSLYLIIKVSKTYKDRFGFAGFKGIYLSTNVKHLRGYINSNRDIILTGEEKLFLYKKNEYDRLLADII